MSKGATRRYKPAYRRSERGSGNSSERTEASYPLLLVEGADYDRIVTVLGMVARNELSQRQATKEFDTSR